MLVKLAVVSRDSSTEWSIAEVLSLSVFLSMPLSLLLYLFLLSSFPPSISSFATPIPMTVEKICEAMSKEGAWKEEETEKTVDSQSEKVGEGDSDTYVGRLMSLSCACACA